MAEQHRFSNLMNLVFNTTRGTKWRIAAVVGLIVLLFSLASYGWFGGRLFDRLDPEDLMSKEPEQLKSITVAQDADFMGQQAELTDQVAQQKRQIRNLEHSETQLRTQLELALSRAQTQPGLSAQDVSSMINRQLQLARAASGQNGAPQAPPKPVLVSSFEPPSPPKSDDPKPSTAPSSREKLPEHAVAIAAGSDAMGMAMNGFLAQSDHQPESVAIELTTPLTGPNGYDVPTSACRVVAECYAKDVIARGRCETTVLTCTLPGGKLQDIPISGWITAADNINGELGTTLWNDWEVWKRMAQASLPAIVAEILDVTTTTVTLGGAAGIITEGVSSPLADIADELGDLLLDRIRAFIYPIVAVDRHQRVHVYIRETAYVKGTTPQDWVYVPSPRSSNPYN